MLIIMQGVPGSGKSTTARQIHNRMETPCSIHSTDSYFMVDGVYKFDPSMLAEYHTRNLVAATADLANGYTVIVDNCNIKNEHAAPYVKFAVARDIPVVFVRCSELFVSEHNVPGATIRRMLLDMETLSVDACLRCK